MSNQEMQFADPDWKPSQQLNNKTNPQEQEEYVPQPINAEYREQNQLRAAPPPPPLQDGYTGLRPYADPAPQQMQGGNFRQRPYRRRGRGPLFWIILAIIIISLASGGSRSFSGFRNGFGPAHSPFDQQHMMGNPITYPVTGQPTIVINDPNGSVTVTEDQNSSNLVIQPTNGNNIFGNPNNIQPVISQDGNTIKVSAPDGQQGSVDLTVTIPQGSNLQLQTVSGNITVKGVDAQMTLATQNGDINATNDVITGSSTISTDSGDIGFDGTISIGGTYQFITNSGTVNVALPSAPAFHIDASTNSGSIDIQGVQNNDSGTKASGNIGGTSHGTNVMIKSGNGDINLKQN